MEVKDLSRTIKKIYDSLADVVFDENKMPTDVATEIAKTDGVKAKFNGKNHDEIQTILDAIIADLDKEIENLNIAGEFTTKSTLEAKKRTVQTGFGFLTESRKKAETFLSRRGKYDEQKYHTERKEDLESEIAMNKEQEKKFKSENQGLYDYAEDLRKYSELVKAYKKLKAADGNLKDERANGDSADVQAKTQAQIDKILEEIEKLGQGLDGVTIAYERGRDNQATITAKITELQNARTQRYNEFSADTLIDATVKAQYDVDALEKFYDTYNAKIASLRVKREALNQQLSDSEESLAKIEKDNGDIRKVYNETGTLKTDKQIGKEALEDTEMAQQVGEEVEQYSNFRTGFGSKFKYFREHGQNPFKAFLSAFVAGKKKMKMLVAADLQKGKVVEIQEREKTAREKFEKTLKVGALEHFATKTDMNATIESELLTRAYGEADKAKKASANEQREPEGEEH